MLGKGFKGIDLFSLLDGAVPCAAFAFGLGGACDDCVAGCYAFSVGSEQVVVIEFVIGVGDDYGCHGFDWGLFWLTKLAQLGCINKFLWFGFEDSRRINGICFHGVVFGCFEVDFGTLVGLKNQAVYG